MKIKTRRGRVTKIAKTLPASEADGENVGMAKFGAAGAKLLAGFLDDARRRRRAARLGAARVRRVRRACVRCHVIGTRGYPWTEIDFPKDYERAVRDVLPAIEHDDRRDRSPRHSPIRPSWSMDSGCRNGR